MQMLMWKFLHELTSLSHRHMKVDHKEGELPHSSFCGSCGKGMSTTYIETHSMRFHDLTPCIDCGFWFEGLSLLEDHLLVSWNGQEAIQEHFILLVIHRHWRDHFQFCRVARRGQSEHSATTFSPRPTAVSSSLAPVIQPTWTKGRVMKLLIYKQIYW